MSMTTFLCQAAENKFAKWTVPAVKGAKMILNRRMALKVVTVLTTESKQLQKLKCKPVH